MGEALDQVLRRDTGVSPDAVQQLLHAVRVHLGMDVAWTSEFVGDTQVFRYVDAEEGATAPRAGETAPMSGSFCARVLDGRVPPAIPDARRAPETALLDITRDLEIGAYLGVPLTGVDGSVHGMLCAVSAEAVPELSDRDADTLRLLADLLHDLQVRALDSAQVEQARAEQRRLLQEVIAGRGRRTVFQPIVEAADHRVVAVEALTRFDDDPSPAQWFDSAHRAGLSVELEVACARSALEALHGGALAAGVSLHVNLSPPALLGPALEDLLTGAPLDRVVVEITEHHAVADYAPLLKALAPWRARGLRVAVDDLGAGYASLRHVLMTRPDVVKVDMALVRGVDGDPVRQALLRAAVEVACSVDVAVVAEGVETEEEHAALRSVGVRQLQGYLLGHPA